MADGFGAVAFGVLHVKPGGSDRADVTEVHIPGGDVNFADVGGMLSNHLDLSLNLTDATYASLRALVGTQATLTEGGTAHINTVLVSLVRTSRWGTGLTFADASFITP